MARREQLLTVPTHRSLMRQDRITERAAISHKAYVQAWNLQTVSWKRIGAKMSGAGHAAKKSYLSGFLFPEASADVQTNYAGLPSDGPRT